MTVCRTVFAGDSRHCLVALCLLKSQKMNLVSLQMANALQGDDFVPLFLFHLSTIYITVVI